MKSAIGCVILFIVPLLLMAFLFEAGLPFIAVFLIVFTYKLFAINKTNKK